MRTVAPVNMVSTPPSAVRDSRCTLRRKQREHIGAAEAAVTSRGPNRCKRSRVRISADRVGRHLNESRGLRYCDEVFRCFWHVPSMQAWAELRKHCGIPGVSHYLVTAAAIRSKSSSEVAA